MESVDHTVATEGLSEDRRACAEVRDDSIHRSAWRNCPKSPDSPKRKAVEAEKTSQKGSICCVMPARSACETPLSDFLDSFESGILRSSFARFCKDRRLEP